MHTFNHSHYETVDFSDDGVGVIETHGYRLKINIRIPEQKIVRWNDLFRRNQSGNSRRPTDRG